MSSASIRVEVHLHADLARLAPEGRGGVLTLDLPPESRVDDVLRRFALPAERSIVVGVNGDAATPERTLHDGERIDLLPPMAGGSGRD